VVGYLIATVIVGDFVEPMVAIKGASAAILFLLGVVIDHVIQLRKSPASKSSMTTTRLKTDKKRL